MKKYCFLILLLHLPNVAISEDKGVTHYQVVDFSGQTISLTKPAKRIVALAPHIVENLFSAGVGDLIVGATDYADYPEAAKAIPRVGIFSGLSVESIIALEPDLVVAWVSGPSSGSYKKLNKYGIPVYLDDPKHLVDIAKSIQDIGVLTGRSVIAEASANHFLSQLSALRQHYTKRRRVDVFYQVWDRPLQTISGQSIISDVIDLCGGKNIFENAAVIAPKISIESVISRNPDVIVSGGVEEGAPTWLNKWLKWPSIKAAKNKHFFYIHPDLMHRHTVRLLEAAKQLCVKLDSVRNNQSLQ